MKKIMFFACAAMLTLASCNGNKAPENNATGNDSITAEAVDTTVSSDPTAVVAALTEKLAAGDETQVTTLLQQAQATYQQLVESGQMDKAAEYMQTVKSYVTEHKDEIAEKLGNSESINTLVKAVSALPTDASTTKEAALQAIEAAKSTLGENAQGALNTAEEAVKNASSEQVTEAVSKVKEAASKVKSEDVDKAVSKAKEAKEALDKAGSDETKAAVKEAAKEKASEAVNKGLNKILGK